MIIRCSPQMISHNQSLDFSLRTLGASVYDNLVVVSAFNFRFSGVFMDHEKVKAAAVSHIQANSGEGEIYELIVRAAKLRAVHQVENNEQR